MRFLGALILSLIIHLTTFELVERYSHSNRAQPLARDFVEIDLVPPVENKQVVLESLVPDWMLTRKGKAKYQSETSKRVIKEMRAKNTGLTQNARGSQARPPKNPSKGGSPGKGTGDLAVKGSENAARPFAPSINISSAATINEDVKAPIGEMTALNTDQYLYYSFFSRVTSQVRFRWEQRIKDNISYAIHKRTRFPSKEVWNTQIEVVLNQEGYFEDYNIEIESGLKEFDEAAAYAFREGAPFLNPPKELIEKDGKLRLKYNLQVNWNPRLMAIPN